MRTIQVGLRANHDCPRDQLNADLLEHATRATSIAVQRLLERALACLVIVKDDAGAMQTANVLLPLRTADQQQRAEILIAKERRQVLPDKGPKETARPQYRNAYHMEEIVDCEGVTCVRCCLAQAFVWQPNRGQQAGQWVRAVELIDATIGLQGLLKSWVPIDWQAVPSALRTGACQLAAQQLMSYLGLIASGAAASAPSLAERDSLRMHAQWRAALARVASGTHQFERVPARELYPEQYAPDDPRGDRLVNVDPDWLAFTASPFPAQQPLQFVKSDDVVLYHHRPSDRLYAALPLLTGVVADSPLGQIGTARALQWWKSRTSEFTSLPVWGERSLSARRQLILLPIEARNPDRLHQLLAGNDGRKVNWASITSRRMKTGRSRRVQWLLNLAISREVPRLLRPNVLGLHFGMTPIVWWTLCNAQGQVISRGNMPQNEILTAGLQAQLRVVQEQDKQRWVGERRFAQELRRRTDEVARQLVAFAAEHNANVALEHIGWVDKRRGGRNANRRYSMWNFAQLPDRIEQFGRDRRQDDRNDPVETIAHVSNFVLRFTCPQCGACRAAKQKPSRATTYYVGPVLHCRSCGWNGEVSDEQQADRVAQQGHSALLRLLEKQKEEE